MLLIMQIWTHAKIFKTLPKFLSHRKTNNFFFVKPFGDNGISCQSVEIFMFPVLSQTLPSNLVYRLNFTVMHCGVLVM